MSPAMWAAAALLLAPYVAAAFCPDWFAAWTRKPPAWVRIALPGLLVVPYTLVAWSGGIFRAGWFALYALLPVTVAALLGQARRVDADERGSWRDLLVLAVLGLAVDLRWFEGAWPAHLAVMNKELLLDAGIYAFVVQRQLGGVGFDLRLRLRDLTTGLRELALYTPLALPVGLALGFLHLHGGWPGFSRIAGAWIFTFLFIAVPEELFFRGWMQNLLERRLGRMGALAATSVLFGLSHFNKRAMGFNWRYVLLAALAGVFYGRAWRREGRVGSSAITHASVDAIWGLWLR